MLIVMAVFDTEENKRTALTEATLRSLEKRVDWTKHRLIISDNGSCYATQMLYLHAKDWLPFHLITNGENLGTARAVNRGWSYRIPGEHVVKMDNDVVVSQDGWADEIEEVFRRDSIIGICGLKRKDLAECPDSQVQHYRSVIRMLPHQPGERWMVVEEVNHVMGTCQAYSSALFERIGFLYQGNWRYGFDDSIASLRAHIAGFKTVFLPHIDIDHIDPGGDSYTLQKQVDAGVVMGQYGQIAAEYLGGQRPIFYDGEDDGKWAESYPI
jgi:GT2 family glycosyltransferase